MEQDRQCIKIAFGSAMYQDSQSIKIGYSLAQCNKIGYILSQCSKTVRFNELVQGIVQLNA